MEEEVNEGEKWRKSQMKRESTHVCRHDTWNSNHWICTRNMRTTAEALNVLGELCVVCLQIWCTLAQKSITTTVQVHTWIDEP